MKEFLYSWCCLTLAAELKWAERAGREMVFLLVLYLLVLTSKKDLPWSPRIQAYLFPSNSPHKTWNQCWILIYIVWNEDMSLSSRIPVSWWRTFYPIYSWYSKLYSPDFLGSLLGWINDSNHLLCLLSSRCVRRVRNNIQIWTRVCKRRIE